MMSRFVVFVLLTINLGATAMADPVFITDARLQKLRTCVENKAEPTFAAWQKLKQRADEALAAPSHAPEHWYVPGYYVDAEGHRTAKQGLADDANNSYTLALAWHITGDDKYALAAARLIDAWPATVKTMSKKDDSTLSFSYHFPSMIFAAGLLEDFDQWPAANQDLFKKFVRERALPLNTMAGKNNWGNWGLVLVMASANYLGDQDLFNRGVIRWKEFIETQIDEQGHLPHEVHRSKGRHGIWYSHFTLFPQTIAAELALVGGVDLYDYVSPKGRTLKMAFPPLAKWVRYPETFHYWHDKPDMLYGVGYYSYFEILNPRWPNEDAQVLLIKARPMTASHSAPHLTFTHGQTIE